MGCSLTVQSFCGVLKCPFAWLLTGKQLTAPVSAMASGNSTVCNRPVWAVFVAASSGVVYAQCVERRMKWKMECEQAGEARSTLGAVEASALAVSRDQAAASSFSK